MDKNELINHELNMMRILVEMSDSSIYDTIEDCISIVSTYVDELYCENDRLKTELKKLKEN